MCACAAISAFAGKILGQIMSQGGRQNIHFDFMTFAPSPSQGNGIELG
jgi:hypothetical protein